jgi:hypothetical protein
MRPPICVSPRSEMAPPSPKGQKPRFSSWMISPIAVASVHLRYRNVLGADARDVVGALRRQRRDVLLDLVGLAVRARLHERGQHADGALLVDAETLQRALAAHQPPPPRPRSASTSAGSRDRRSAAPPAPPPPRSRCDTATARCAPSDCGSWQRRLRSAPASCRTASCDSG